METRQNEEWEDVLNLEDRFYKQGYGEGYTDGAKQGLIEGRIYGAEQGYERLFKIGLLQGKVSVWKATHKDCSHRVQKQLEKVAALLDSCPMANEEHKEGGDYDSVYALAVSKMKALASVLHEPGLVEQGLVDATRLAASGDIEDIAEMGMKLKPLLRQSETTI